MLFLVVLSAVLLAVVVFALQNAQAVAVRFLFWQVQSSLAVVTIAATAAGVLIATLFGYARRFWRWKRGQGGAAEARADSD
jgi:uncharacterized integral membrane protein